MLGYQILMILGDFGGPGVHFLMIFDPAKVPRARAKVPKAFVILETLPPRKSSPFLRSKCDQERTFCSVVFQCLFERPFFLILCDLECPEIPFWEGFGSHFGSFFWNPGFFDFDNIYNENQTFLEAGGTQN